MQPGPRGCLEAPPPSSWGLYAVIKPGRLHRGHGPGFSEGISFQVCECPSPPASLPQPASTMVAQPAFCHPAVTVVLVLPQSYFLSRAQSLCGPERSAVPDSLRWLCHPLGQKFFMERSWSVKSAAKESLYCAQRSPGESTCAAMRATGTAGWLHSRHVGTQDASAVFLLNSGRS